MFHDTLISKNNQAVWDLFAVAFTVWFPFRNKQSKANKILKLNYWWLNFSPKQRIRAVKASLPSLPVMFKLDPDIILQEKEQKVSSQSNSGTRSSTQMHHIVSLVFQFLHGSWSRLETRGWYVNTAREEWRNCWRRKRRKGVKTAIFVNWHLNIGHWNKL